ncbi:MAG TPA: type III effector, partial [Cellvibrionales bacterium]|nr:type III effector [Cellvibrionales bacterium]
GKYYRDDVLGNPSGDDHANIRNFILDGWLGIQFDTEPLALKS